MGRVLRGDLDVSIGMENTEAQLCLSMLLRKTSQFVYGKYLVLSTSFNTPSEPAVDNWTRKAPLQRGALSQPHRFFSMFLAQQLLCA